MNDIDEKANGWVFNKQTNWPIGDTGSGQQRGLFIGNMKRPIMGLIH